MCRDKNVRQHMCRKKSVRQQMCGKFNCRAGQKCRDKIVRRDKIAEQTEYFLDSPKWVEFSLVSFFLFD